ncbi:hypothetical protein [Gordonia sp. KTR9]|uniref:hypothetical protein n=1 Tax=Gordonia sp. KTR9 TaxID=337191 RepID=UPI00027DDEB3|nr:hypothetical protein [Gordonia sp. KTR9]AFR50020.1 hypothetical protein KTR9_3385 [Gordonia sp. KTR9]
MTSAASDYYAVTDQVIELARGLALTGNIDTRDVEALLDVSPGLLTRVTTNLACAEYLLIAQHLGFNLADDRIIVALIEPLQEFEIIKATHCETETTVRDVILGMQAFTKNQTTISEAVVPLYRSGAASPSALVLNGAMPVIHALMQKCISLASDPYVVGLTDEGRATKLDQTIASIRTELSTYLKPH